MYMATLNNMSAAVRLPRVGDLTEAAGAMRRGDYATSMAAAMAAAGLIAPPSGPVVFFKGTLSAPELVAVVTSSNKVARGNAAKRCLASVAPRNVRRQFGI